MAESCVVAVQAPMQPPKALRMPETEETAEEFVGAELEMLAMGAKSIPPSSTLGAPARLDQPYPNPSVDLSFFLTLSQPSCAGGADHGCRVHPVRLHSGCAQLQFPKPDPDPAIAL